MMLAVSPFAGPDDYPQIADLIAASAPLSPHRLDFPWRWAGPVAEQTEDARLWTDDRGVLVGLAAWQSPWGALDWYVRSGPDATAVEEAIFAWAAARFRALDRERGHALPYWCEADVADTGRRAVLARHGYRLEDDGAYVLLRRPLAEPLPPARLPDGFTIRSLAGGAEAEAYAALHRAAFGSALMTAAWRRRTLHALPYRADLDLVAVAPDGELAGFCVCWLGAAGREGQIEPLGVHPRFQRQGLARALLPEGIRRLQALGATIAWVETETSRSPARQTYEAAGFRVASTIRRYGRWMTEGCR